MTGGARPSATGGARASWALLGRQPTGPWQAEGGETACGENLRGCRRTSQELGRDANGLEGGLAGWLASLFFQKPIPFLIKQPNLNSNQDLNPNTQKQCTGMNATHTQLFI
jgi:hypothetical protein